MRVYLAYASEYMECPELVGVFYRAISAKQEANKRANFIDAKNRLILEEDGSCEFTPAQWYVSEIEVREE